MQNFVSVISVTGRQTIIQYASFSRFTAQNLDLGAISTTSSTMLIRFRLGHSNSAQGRVHGTIDTGIDLLTAVRSVSSWSRGHYRTVAATLQYARGLTVMLYPTQNQSIKPETV